MRILSIGNSFSEDAQTYLSKIAELSGVKITSFNMMIGGCSLARHYRNMLTGEKAYTLQINGESTGISINLEDVLLAGYWDAITFQQVSSSSPSYESFQPYLSELVAYARRYAPKSRIYLHETWAYEQGSPRLPNIGYEDQADMYRDIHKTYLQAAADVKADGIIPSGAAFQHLFKHGAKIHHDGSHASHGIGHVTLGATWLTYFAKIDPRGLDWSALKTRVPVSAEDYALAQEAAWVACQS